MFMIHDEYGYRPNRKLLLDGRKRMFREMFFTIV